MLESNVGIKMTEELKGRFEEQAAKEGLKISAYIRQCAETITCLDPWVLEILKKAAESCGGRLDMAIGRAVAHVIASEPFRMAAMKKVGLLERSFLAHLFFPNKEVPAKRLCDDLSNLYRQCEEKLLVKPESTKKEKKSAK